MPTNITNEASATYQFSGSRDVLAVSSNTTNINLEDSSGLIISKTASPTTFSNGDIITYTITITNNSSSYLNGVRIIDNLGGENRLAYVLGSGSLSTSTETYPVSPIATEPLTFTLQQLAVGQTMTLTYQSQVFFNLPQTIQTITNSVQGIGYTATGTIQGFDSSLISRNSTIPIQMSKTSNLSSVSKYQVFNYTISLENTSSILATNVSIFDELPSNFVVTQLTLQIGQGSPIVLSGTDYSISSTNVLNVYSVGGSTITIPADGVSNLTVYGYFI